MEPNPYTPPVVLTSLQQNGKEVNADRAPEDLTEVTFRWPDNTFEFGFAALNYTQPGKNQHAYMLEGFDEDWNHIGARRFGRYTNLPGGKYTLRLKGSNNDGVWNEEGASIQVAIVPPFWSTWWFRAIAALVLVAGAAAGYGLRVRSLQARSRDLEKQVMNRTKELAALNAIAATVSRSLHLDEVLNGALDKTLHVMEIEAGGIYLLDEEAGVLTVAAERGFSPEFVAGIDRLKVGEGFSGRVAQSGQPLLVRNISTDPRLTRMVVRHAGLRSAAIVPLSSKGKVLGTMFAITRGYREFTDQDIQLLTSIGDQIGVAVENARLYEQAQQVAVVEERQRLARELHDSVTQALYGVTLYSEAAAGHLALGHTDRTAEHLQELQDTAQEALAEMRLLVFELRPPILEELGLAAALQARLQAVEGRAGLRTEFKTNVDQRLPPDVEEGLYRIALEALNNALKHAQARNIGVHLRQERPTVTLEIADDGIGFDPAAASEGGGVGLSAMQERAVELGGRLTVRSAPGSGTRIAAVWTIDERGEPNE
jgi:signal transduction histidine kinase